MTNKSKENKEIIVLLHGILRGNFDMQLICNKFEANGYDTINIPYPSTEHRLEDLSDFVHKEITSFPAYREDTTINFVTHSMGGLIARYYIKREQPKNLGKVVMLSPPNGGSEFADLFSDTNIIAPIFRTIFGPASDQLRTDYSHIDDDINYPLGIIAGNVSLNPIAPWVLHGEHDGIVPVERTKIKGMSDHIVLSTSHSFMMFDTNVIDQTLHFMQQGQFLRIQEKKKA